MQGILGNDRHQLLGSCPDLRGSSVGRRSEWRREPPHRHDILVGIQGSDRFPLHLRERDHAHVGDWGMNREVGDRELTGRHCSSGVRIANRSATDGHPERVLVGRDIEQQEGWGRPDQLGHVAIDYSEALLVYLLCDFEAPASAFLFLGLRRLPFGRHLSVERESFLFDLGQANVRIAIALACRSRLP